MLPPRPVYVKGFGKGPAVGTVERRRQNVYHPVTVTRFQAQMIAESKLFDPRATIVSMGAALAVTLLVRLSLPALAALNIYLFALLGISPGGMALVLKTVRRVLILSLFVIALNGVAVRGGAAALKIADWTVLSRVGVDNGVYFALRLSAMVVGLAALLAHAPPETFARGVFALVSPFSGKLARTLAFYGFTTTGFVPLFLDEFERIRIAQSFRGGTLGGGIRDRATTVRMILIPLILSCVHRSEQLAGVVQLRGLKSRIGQVQAGGRLRPSDIIFVLMTASVLVSVTLVSVN